MMSKLTLKKEMIKALEDQFENPDEVLIDLIEERRGKY